LPDGWLLKSPADSRFCAYGGYLSFLLASDSGLVPLTKRISIKTNKKDYQTMTRFGIIVIAGILLAGCAAPKTWVATGGSRADGVVTLAYDVGLFESAVVDEQQAISEATSRCAVWGYTGAVAFGGTLSTCLNSDCTASRISKDYQCTNDTQ
jgi:hypothetical protein